MGYEALMSKTRAIRFSDQEEKLINEFLMQNPFFDFSSLARTALFQFIEEPKVKIRPVKLPKKFSGEVSNVRR